MALVLYCLLNSNDFCVLESVVCCGASVCENSWSLSFGLLLFSPSLQLLWYSFHMGFSFCWCITDLDLFFLDILLYFFLIFFSVWLLVLNFLLFYLRLRDCPLLLYCVLWAHQRHSSFSWYLWSLAFLLWLFLRILACLIMLAFSSCVSLDFQLKHSSHKFRTFPAAFLLYLLMGLLLLHCLWIVLFL